MPRSVCCFWLALAWFAVAVGTVDAADKRSNKNNNREKQRAAQRAREAQRRQIQQSIQRVRAQIAAAQKVLPRAEQQVAQSQAALQAAESRVQGSIAEVDATAKSTRVAAEYLKGIEEQVLTSSNAGSEFSAARQRLEAVEQELGSARNRILKSPAYLQRYEKALKSPNKAQLLTALRRDALDGDPQYVAALAGHRVAQTEYDKLRRELLLSSDQWVDATKESQEARKSEMLSEAGLKASLRNRNNQRDQLARARAAVATATTTIKKGQATLKQLEAKARQLGNNNNNRKKRR